MSKTRGTEGFLAAILYLAAALIVVTVSFLMDLRLPIGGELAKPFGIFLVIIGMALVSWAGMYMRWGLLGEVEPKLERLVQDGPYGFVRHPFYLGMTIALTGVAVALRSYLGLLAVLFLFLPSAIYRARQEDRALKVKFGSQWDDYAAGRGFILPFRRKI